eukprot:GFUD01028600.1.p1 GENE.GFUD01028600.1~~GFUD01028600.1.p1  ORF type:complete len:140 (-),score=14.25 GFUD01028600.1:97-489(-)
MIRPIFFGSFLSIICIAAGRLTSPQCCPWPGDVLQCPCKYAEMQSQNDLLEKARIAFNECNSDSVDGLTWVEVEHCEETYADLNITLPSREQFKNADLSRDGILVIAEGEEWIYRYYDYIEMSRCPTYPC